MDGFSDPITWSRNFDDEEFDEDYCEELPEVTFSVRSRCGLQAHHVPVYIMSFVQIMN